jgi:hypothetical protein
MSTLFINAARNKYRFPSIKGDLTVEQLFDLPLESKAGFDLDAVAKSIHAQLLNASRPSFVNPGTTAGPATELNEKLELVVTIIQTKQREAQAAVDAAKRKAERAQLVELLSDKKNQQLLNLTVDEIERRIALLS